MAAEYTSEEVRVKTSLNRLAGDGERDVIERASAAIERIDLAADFVETFGIGDLELAVEATEDDELASNGKRALEAFYRFRSAAADRPDSVEHFHFGHATNLRGESVDQIR